MLKCPVCCGKIPFWKPWYLTNFNSISCPSCGRKLYADKKVNARMGAIGGAAGAVILLAFKSKDKLWPIVAAILCILLVLLASSVFTKFEVKKDENE